MSRSPLRNLVFSRDSSSFHMSSLQLGDYGAEEVSPVSGSLGQCATTCCRGLSVCGWPLKSVKSRTWLVSESGWKMGKVGDGWRA